MVNMNWLGQLAQLIPAIMKDSKDYMTGETWWNYGPNYFKNYKINDWMESYLDEYENLKHTNPQLLV